MKTTIARTACILSSMAFCLTSLDLSAKEYYKWVDAKGSTHYTTTPPPKNAQRKGKVKYLWCNNDYAINSSKKPRRGFT
jgi:hypothetical protein